MKKLNEPLENGLIPLVEIAKIIFQHIDFSNPKFYDDKLFIKFIGDNDSCGITEYLYFEDNQFKIEVNDSYWTSDTYREYSRPIEYNQIILFKKLIDLGVTTYNELGL